MSVEAHAVDPASSAQLLVSLDIRVAFRGLLQGGWSTVSSRCSSSTAALHKVAPWMLVDAMRTGGLLRMGRGGGPCGSSGGDSRTRRLASRASRLRRRKMVLGYMVGPWASCASWRAGHVAGLRTSPLATCRCAWRRCSMSNAHCQCGATRAATAAEPAAGARFCAARPGVGRQGSTWRAPHSLGRGLAARRRVRFAWRNRAEWGPVLRWLREEVKQGAQRCALDRCARRLGAANPSPRIAGVPSRDGGARRWKLRWLLRRLGRGLARHSRRASQQRRGPAATTTSGLQFPCARGGPCRGQHPQRAGVGRLAPQAAAVQVIRFLCNAWIASAWKGRQPHACPRVLRARRHSARCAVPYTPPRRLATGRRGASTLRYHRSGYAAFLPAGCGGGGGRRQGGPYPLSRGRRGPVLHRGR